MAGNPVGTANLLSNAGSVLGGAGGALGAGLLAGFPVAGLIAALAPGLISKLFGGNPQEKLRRKVQELSSPGMLSKLTAQHYQALQGGPAFQQALGNIAAGANATGNSISSELGARGIGTSGTGAILSSLTPSIVGGQQAQLRSTTQGIASQQAQQQVQQMISALMGTQGPSQTQQLLGSGLEAFGPLLQQWLRTRYPQFGAQA